MKDETALIGKRTWAEIDLSALKHNYDTIRGSLPEGASLCCVVKANAYGHGAQRLAPLYEQWGADWFAVSNIEEALELRACGVTRPVLILGYTPADCAPLLSRHRLSQCVYSAAYAAQLSACALQAGVTVPVHIKLDTGMGRIGFACVPEETIPATVEEVWQACRLPGLFPEGVFTHFASADEGEERDRFTGEQLQRFTAVVETLARRGLTFPLHHCANSAALTDHPDCCMNMVRAGIVLYGLQPSDQLRHPHSLRPAMSLRSVVSHVKTVAPGATISYGHTFTAQRAMRVATVPIGYADGYWRQNAAAGAWLAVRGQPAPILGRICMDQLMVDVTHIPDVAMGDEVVVFGTAPAPTACQLARRNDTIGYEILCAVGERVPRVYVQEDKEKL